MKLNKLFSKDTLFKIHAWIGVKLSILLFVVCFSGTLAVFSHEFDWLFNAKMRAVPTTETASRNVIVEGVMKLFPGSAITYWERSREPYLTDIVYVKHNGKLHYVFANPYTGEIQGSSHIMIQRFFRDLHYYLFIPDQVGNYLVLFFGFVLTVSLITGMFYYRGWYKKLFVLQTGKGSSVFYSSLHKLVGAWSIPFMILICSTCIWYFVERSDVPAISKYMDNSRPEIPEAIIAKFDTTALIDYDRCVAVAEAAIPGLEVKTIVPPSKPDLPVYLTGTSDVPLVRYRANRVYVNPYTFEVIKIQNAEDINTVTWLNDIMDPLHFGYWGGWITKVIWFIFGLGISSLVLTGPWLYIKRRLKLSRLQKERRLSHG